MGVCTWEKATQYIQLLAGEPLVYAWKSSDCDLYDLGFGKIVSTVSFRGEKKEFCSYVLHATCRFEIIYRKDKHKKLFDEETTADEFQLGIAPLMRLPIKRVGLGDQNDLWLDFGDYWMIFNTFEDDEESWRFFPIDGAHLVATSRGLDL